MTTSEAGVYRRPTWSLMRPPRTDGFVYSEGREPDELRGKLISRITIICRGSAELCIVVPPSGRLMPGFWRWDDATTDVICYKAELKEAA